MTLPTISHGLTVTLNNQTRVTGEKKKKMNKEKVLRNRSRNPHLIFSAIITRSVQQVDPTFALGPIR